MWWLLVLASAYVYAQTVSKVYADTCNDTQFAFTVYAITCKYMKLHAITCY